MPVWIRNYIKFLIAALLIFSFCVAEGDAQTRRKKRRRSAPAAPKPVITNPAIAPPEATQSPDTSGDVKIISTADSTKEPGSTENLQGGKPKVTAPEPTEGEKTQQTISDLSKQVDRLNNKLTSMQEDDRYQLDMERLTRAEQRAEQLRSQLMDVQSKIADFEAKIEQIDWALRPENIEASTAGYGSTRPEAARDARKKQLESEKTRTQAQLKLAESSKSRLEGAVSNADAEVDALRAKLEQRRAQMDAAPPVETPAAKPRKPQN
jgi:predicted  nucleic acid-binding Zn-ribbon protein